MRHYIIYKTTNNITGEFYIGKHITDNIEDGYFGSGKLLHRAIKKYGLQNFTFHLEFELANAEELSMLEKEVVNKDFIKRDDVYNLVVGGDGGWLLDKTSPCKGKRLSEQTRKKLSDSHKGQIPWNKGGVSKYKGVPRSELTKKKISQSIKANGKLAGKNNPNWGKTGSGVTFYGRHHTEEAKKKIGAASKSRSMSEETKAKLRDRMLNHTSYTKGMHWSEETKQKQRLGNILYRLRMKFQLIMLYFIVSFSY